MPRRDILPTPELHPARLLTGLMAGLVVGVVVVIVAISFAVLIFSGELSAFVPNGIGLALFTAAVMAAVIALTSSFPGMVATPQDVPAAITALIAASVAGSMAPLAEPDAVFATVVAAVALTSLTTGLFFLALGHFKLGALVRFIPYPVIGGFLAGTGWLLVRGSFAVLADHPLTPGNLRALAATQSVLRWAPGLAFALLVLVVLRRTRRFAVLPGMLVAAIVVFYLLLAATGTSLSEASSQGWLLGPFPSAEIWKPIGPAMLAKVEWPVLFGEAGSMLAVLLVGMVALLLNATGLELLVHRDIDLDRELRGAGVANILSGLGGGLVGFQTLSLSTLGHRMAPSSRLVGLTSAGLCAASLLFGSTLLSVFPKPILGGLLLFLGLAFLVEWVYDAWFKLPKVDYFVIILILMAIATVGFLESVGLGIVIAVILFVVNYSRIDVVKHTLSGTTHRSNVQRVPRLRRALDDHGHELFILQLQGFIFFGTSNKLVEQLRTRMADTSRPKLRHLVLDFRLVSGIDSSAVLGFVKMQQLAAAEGLALIFAQTPPEIRSQLEKNGIREGGDGLIQWFSELDRAVEWCEDQILVSHGLSLDEEPLPLEERLAQVFPATVDPSRVMRYLERQQVPVRHFLMRQGEAPEDIYLIESGRVTVEIELAGQLVRILTIGAGTVVGQQELYLGSERAASVVTDTPSVVHRLSTEALKRMETDEPELAIALHHYMARVLTESLIAIHRTLEAVLR